MAADDSTGLQTETVLREIIIIWYEAKNTWQHNHKYYPKC